MKDRPAQVAEGDERRSFYLVEAYMPSARAEALTESALRARSAARALTGQGMPVRYVRSTFLLEDETCFHVFEAASAASVWEASRRAALGAARVLPVLEARCLS